jgi:uncharacterized repeat protein (TIGR01451 family)
MAMPLVLSGGLFLLFLGLVAGMGPAPVQALPLGQVQMVSLTPLKDNTIFNPGDTLSNGLGPNFFVGRTAATGGNRVLRSLIAFDIANSGIPAGSTITSVTLNLTSFQGRGGARTVELHKGLADWGEGTSFDVPGGGEIWADAQPGDATWSHRFFNTTLWTTPGGDFAATTSAVASVGDFGGGVTWGSTSQMVADVQDWLDNPANNFGWLLKMDNETPTQTAKRFGSKDDPTPANRPQLIIHYTPPVSGSAALTLQKRVNNSAPQAGERITYTVIISNSGLMAASGAVVSDTIPAGLTFIGPVSLSPPAAGLAGSPPGLVTNLTIAAKSLVTVTFPVTVNSGVATGTLISNRAAVTSTEVITPQVGAVTVVVGGKKVFLPVIRKA